MKEDNILDILKPYDNDMLSLMNRRDLYYLKSCLKKYMLDMRENLNLSNDITFGLEIEVDNIQDNIYSLRKNKMLKDWVWKNDDTLILGQEVVSPSLKDEIKTWDTLEYLLTKLGECSVILPTCGGHIHIGAQIFGDNRDDYYNLYLLWRAYENIIFRFGYGEYISERKDMNKYAIPFLSSFKFANYNHFFIELHNRMSLSYGKISENHLSDYKNNIYGNTIELRSPNGSLNPIIWQNNINFFVKLMLYAKSNNFSRERMNDRIATLREKAIVYNDVLNYFKLIDLESALELADLIYDNNIDKVYFLRQYIKNEEVGVETLQKGKKFTNFKYY